MSSSVVAVQIAFASPLWSMRRARASRSERPSCRPPLCVDHEAAEAKTGADDADDEAAEAKTGADDEAAEAKTGADDE